MSASTAHSLESLDLPPDMPAHPAPSGADACGRKKRISVLTPCYNEEENVRELYETVKAVFEGLPHYGHQHLFIDNASKHRTVGILKEIAAVEPKVGIIVKTRNFGHIRDSRIATSSP
jgi:glycosyltransferase involved in cell wall biosynthesis